MRPSEHKTRHNPFHPFDRFSSATKSLRRVMGNEYRSFDQNFFPNASNCVFLKKHAFHETAGVHIFRKKE
jgi:hypothetical protein